MLKPSILWIVGAIALFVSMFALGGCADMGGTSPWVTRDQCNGQPTWCIKVANEADEDMDVYLNGSVVGTVGGDQTVFLPVTAGQQYTINACYEVTMGLFQIPVKKVCLDANTFVATGNRPYILYPTQ